MSDSEGMRRKVLKLRVDNLECFVHSPGLTPMRQLDTLSWQIDRTNEFYFCFMELDGKDVSLISCVRLNSAIEE